MKGPEPFWNKWLGSILSVLLGFAVYGLIWGGSITQRVAAAEQKSSDIALQLNRIEDKLDGLILLLVGHP